MMTLRQARLQQLRAEVRQLDEQRRLILDEIQKLDLEQKKEDHPCSCVKLNSDIEIFDMGEQERRGRTALSVGGFVMYNLSARKDCTACNGTGKTTPVPSYHTCETFNPDTCAACRVIQRNID